MNCYVCNNELIWGGDHDIEDIIEDQDHTIVTNLSCQQCGAYVEVYHSGMPAERKTIESQNNP